MELLKSLHKIGLSENQAKVYLACLQSGVASVLHIAQNAELKRPTVYLLLDDLEKIGMVSRVKKGKKIHYKAEPPTNIVSKAEQKLKMAQEILPSLKAIYNLDPEKPNIKIADGIQGVKSVYNGIFTYLLHHPNEELLIFGSLKDAIENFQTSVVDYFYETMGRSKNPIREIGNNDHETRMYYRKSVALNPKHEIRLIRDEGVFTQTDNMLYGNTLIIFSVKKEIFATILESASIAKTYRTLFNMAWRAGKPI